MEFPMPNDSVLVGFSNKYGEDREIVIASSYIDDDNAIILTLRKNPPYYRVATPYDERFFRNIVPAVEFYQNESGCY